MSELQHQPEQNLDHSQEKQQNGQNKNQVSQERQNPLIYVNQSQEFQNIEISRSQGVSSSFNDLKLSDQGSPHDQLSLHNSNQSDSIQLQDKQIAINPQKQEVEANHDKQVSQIFQSVISDWPQNQTVQIQSSADDTVILTRHNNKIVSKPQNQSEPIQQNQKDQNSTSIQQKDAIQIKPEQNVQTQPKIENQNAKNQQKQDQKDQNKQNIDFEGLVSLKIFQKRINESLQFKNQGNDFYKENLYQEAIKKYSQGLRILDPQQFYGATQAQCQKMAQVSASLLFNIGCCFFNLNVWKNAEIYFTQTITINPNHVKAIYKRALCRYNMQNYDEAMSDIKEAFYKDKSNAEIHKSYQKILQKYNQQVKRQKQSLKQMSSKIFRKDSQKSLQQSQKSQKSINLNKSQTDRQNFGQNKENKQGQNEQNGSSLSDLWGFAPLVAVAGVALFLGYKKWFSK